jgi:hypothetical protein
MRFRTFPALLLVLSATGCHSWHAQAGPTPDAIAAQTGRGLVRVTRRDHGQLVLVGARVMGDSIVGQAGTPPQRTAVAMADVERIDTRATSAGRTAGLVLGVAVVAFAALLVAAAASLTPDWN